MEAILIPIVGFAVALSLSLACLLLRQLRPLVVALFVGCSSGSVALWFGALWLMDLNPAVEYGRPELGGHPSTSFDRLLVILITVGVAVTGGIIGKLLQSAIIGVLCDLPGTPTPLNLTEENEAR